MNNSKNIQIGYVVYILSLSLTILILGLFTENAIAQIELPKSIESPLEPDTSVFQDSSNGFKIEYPSNWTKIESDDKVQFFAQLTDLNDQYFERITFDINESPRALNDLVNSFVDFYSLALNDFRIIDSLPVNITNHDAYMIIFSNKNSQLQDETQIVIFLKMDKNRFIQITFSSESKTYPIYSPIVQKMINSFEILPTPIQSNEPVLQSKMIGNNISTFEDKYHGIRINFPEEWSYRMVLQNIQGDSIKELAIFNPDSSRNISKSLIFTIGLEHVGQTSLDDYTGIQNQILSSANNINKSEPTIISERPSHKTIYQSEGVTGLRTWTIYNNNAYVIQVLAETNIFNKYSPIVQKMINSFEILPISNQNQEFMSFQNNNDNTNKSMSYDTYENVSHGIKIDYPSTWAVKDESKKANNSAICYLLIHCAVNKISFSSPMESFSDMVREGVSLTYFFAKESTLQHLVNLFISADEEELNSYRMIDSRQVSLKDGTPALIITYQYQHPSLGLVNKMDTYVLKFKTAYVISAIIEPNKYSIYSPIVQKMINSFEILPISNQNQEFMSFQNNNDNTNKSMSYDTYENVSHGIKIDYPSTWAIKEVELPSAMKRIGFAVNFISIPQNNFDIFQEKMFLMTMAPLEEDVTVESTVLDKRMDLNNLPSVKNIKINTTRLGDLPAQSISYLSSDGQLTQNVEVIAKRYDRMYILSWEIPASETKTYLPMIKEITQNFQIPYSSYINSTTGTSILYPFEWMDIVGHEKDNLTAFSSVLGSCTTILFTLLVLM